MKNINNINYGSLEMVSILRVAPGECHRIIAKADARLARCDQLEASLTTTHSRLLEALLHKTLGGQAEVAA